MNFTVSEKYRELLAWGVLAFAVLAVYGNVGTHTPIPFDDALYVTGNHHVSQGLRWEEVKWAFTNVDAANWHPVTWLSHLADQQFFGGRTGILMFQNVLWHILNSLLVYTLLRKLFSHRGLAVALALIFACHPLNVESVAWLSQRKSQLSTFFLLATILIYLDWRQTRRLSSFLVMVLAYTTSLMAKATGVTLPAILFVYELASAWSRLTASEEDASRARLWKTALAAIRPQIAFAACACGMAVVTYIAQKSGGAVSSLEALPLSLRFQNAAAAIDTYCRDFLFPGDLCLYYPLEFPIGWTRPVLGGAILAASVAIFLLTIRRRPMTVLGVAWFYLTLLPVIGLVQVGSQSHADRYMYLPMIGLLMVAADVLPRLLARVMRPATAAAALAFGGLAGVFALHASAHLVHWRDAEAAYRRSWNVGGPSFTMALNLSSTLSGMGFPRTALHYAEKACQLQPASPLGPASVGGCYGNLSEWEKALEWYEKAVQLAPDAAQHHFNVGFALVHLDRNDDAEPHFQRARELLTPTTSWNKSVELLRAVLEKRIPLPPNAAELAPLSLTDRSIQESGRAQP